MNRLPFKLQAAGLLVALATGRTAECQFARPQLTFSAPAVQATQPQAQSGAAELVIENDSRLPSTYPGANYTVLFEARGSPVFHWRVSKGALPPGLKLEDEGTLHGWPQRDGEFQFTVSVTDGNNQTVQKLFEIRVESAFTVDWKTKAHVSGNRIEGSVEVTNTTPDPVDLTFIVLAEAGNGRATAIGYQHFVLPLATLKRELPFGETLPRGGYVVHVDVVGEVAAKKLIYRKQLQTSGPLQVSVGP